MNSETHVKDNSMKTQMNTLTMKNTMQREMHVQNISKDGARSRTWTDNTTVI